MDFFNSKAPNPSSSNPYDGLETPFAQAVNGRHGINVPSSLLTAKLTPALPLQTPMLPSSGLGYTPSRSVVPRLPPLPQGTVLGPSVTTTFHARVSSTSSTMSSSAFASLLPEELVAMIPSQELLLIDIRTHGLFQQSRLPGSISLVIPSTLLRRPNFPLEKMAGMINDTASRARFENWKSVKTIVAYDVDTSFMSESNNISGLLRKFQAAGFRGELKWLKGGFDAYLTAFPGSIDGTEQVQTSDEAEESENTSLRTRNLSAHAFLQSSTTLLGQMTPRGIDRGQTTTSSVAANPFYDNIRQNIELSQGVDSKIPLVLPPQVLARRNELPFKWLRDIIDQTKKDPEGDSLARQFYRIELGEQRRLRGVMEHHSRESGLTPAASNMATTPSFPYSITAGVEMGTKNRYRNIWPFEHARVRIQKPHDKGSDYVNASYVQSVVSPRRYIATQGPLDSTFNDFWSICWEQNVSVIVMLTREIESSQRKCGNYWKDGSYGDFNLKLMKQVGAEDVHKGETGGFYHFPKAEEKASDAIIERVFHLSNRAHPRSPPRKITHLQYLEWSDMDVPSTPDGLFALIKRVNLATGEGASTSQSSGQGPILLHCSAGVGRTGGFIMVDSLLSGIKREMQSRKPFLGQHHNPLSPEMDVDEPESVASQISLPLRPDFDSSRSSLLTTSSNSGSDAALQSSAPSSIHRPSSAWSAEAVQGSARATPFGRFASPKPKKLSQVIVDKLAKDTKASTVAQWSKALPSAASTASLTPYFGDVPPSSDEGTIKSGVDYKMPRRLDAPDTPRFPSSMSEPIQEVLDDLREQRMSLCQSLRQYVFVHRAVIEGALELVDEAKGARRPFVGDVGNPNNELAWSSTSSIASAGEPPSSPPSRAMAGRLSSSTSRSSSSPPLQPKALTGKRSASSGEGRLAKHFSKKKKHRNDSDTPPSNSRPQGSSIRGPW